MKKIIIQTIILLSPLILFGQEKIKTFEVKRNSIYFEAFGQGLYNSFSFDKLYNVDRKIKTSINAGITIIPSGELFVLASPIAYNFLFGLRNNHLELGFGITAMYIRNGNINVGRGIIDENGNQQHENFIGHENNFYSYFTPKIGYRFQRPSGGLFLRVTLTPSIAGINRLSGTKGGIYDKYSRSETEYFTSAAFFGYRAFPWAGLSIGWTLKK